VVVDKEIREKLLNCLDYLFCLLQGLLIAILMKLKEKHYE